MMNSLTNEEKKYLAMGIEEDERTGGKITCQYPEKETEEIVYKLASSGDDVFYISVAKELAAFWKNYFDVSPEYAKEEQEKKYKERLKEIEEWREERTNKKKEEIDNYLGEN